MPLMQPCLTKSFSTKVGSSLSSGRLSLSERLRKNRPSGAVSVVASMGRPPESRMSARQHLLLLLDNWILGESPLILWFPCLDRTFLKWVVELFSHRPAWSDWTWSSIRVCWTLLVYLLFPQCTIKFYHNTNNFICTTQRMAVVCITVLKFVRTYIQYLNCLVGAPSIQCWPTFGYEVSHCAVHVDTQNLLLDPVVTLFEKLRNANTLNLVRRNLLELRPPAFVSAGEFGSFQQGYTLAYFLTCTPHMRRSLWR